MKSYKTEIKPNKKQIQLIEQTFGNVRYLYNSYLSYNQKVYKETGKFISGYEYSKLLNNQLDKPEWLTLSSSKANKQAIMYAEGAFKRFFKKQSGFPRYKSKKHSKQSFYLTDTIKVERHRIFLPKLKWVKLKEFGYIPNNVTSVTVSKNGERYYVSCLVKEEIDNRICTNPNLGFGIDLGIKDFATISNGEVYPNINKSSKIRKYEKRLKRLQRSLSRKYENNRISKKSYRWKKPVEDCSSIQKQQKEIKRIYTKLSNIRTNYILQIIHDIVKRKPSFITIEDLNVSGMMKNKYLAKSIANQNFTFFVTRLTQKCKELGIELRQVSRFYPSSKLCSSCRFHKKDLQLKDRIYQCNSCGIQIDRDLNASLNLVHAKEYSVLS